MKQVVEHFPYFKHSAEKLVRYSQRFVSIENFKKKWVIYIFLDKFWTETIQSNGEQQKRQKSNFKLNLNKITNATFRPKCQKKKKKNSPVLLEITEFCIRFLIYVVCLRCIDISLIPDKIYWRQLQRKEYSQMLEYQGRTRSRQFYRREYNQMLEYKGKTRSRQFQRREYNQMLEYQGKTRSRLAYVKISQLLVQIRVVAHVVPKDRFVKQNFFFFFGRV